MSLILLKTLHYFAILFAGGVLVGGGLIVNYGNLNLDYSKIYTLPLLGKRIHLRFHSIFDTMRFADQRKEGVEWINDQMNKGNLKPIIS